MAALAPLTDGCDMERVRPMVSDYGAAGKSVGIYGHSVYCLACAVYCGRLPDLGGVAASLVAESKTDVSALSAFPAAFLCHFGGGGFAGRAVGLNIFAKCF